MSYFSLPSKPVKPILKNQIEDNSNLLTLFISTVLGPLCFFISGYCGPEGSRTPVRTAYPGTR